MSHSQLHFYDAANPRNVPSGVHAAAYVNGFAWPEADLKRMSGIFLVSVLPGAEWADKARCIDVESGAAAPQNVVPFIQRRESHGWHDSIAYVNRSNWHVVKGFVDAALKAGKIHVCHYWVATLDGTTHVPGAWAVQYQGGMNAGFDLSVVNDGSYNPFHKP